MQANMKVIDPNMVIGEVAKIKVAGFRFVTMSASVLDNGGLDLIYHFDKDLAMKHLRLTVPQSSTLPSISPLYFAAVLVENELQDLFGLCFSGLLLDYAGTFLLEEEVQRMPFGTLNIRNGGRTADQASGGAGERTARREGEP